VWRKYRAPAENLFLWQVIYRAHAVNHNRGRFYRDADGVERHSPRRRDDPETWCKCCELQAHETSQHCFWQCPRALKVWSWVQDIMRHSTAAQPVNFRLNLEQSLLGAELENCPRDTPKVMWEIIRAVTGRFMWNTRCSKCMEGKATDDLEVIHKVWHRMKTYFNAEWLKRVIQVKKGRISMSTAQKQFHKDFGWDTRLFYFDSDQLVISKLAPC
jgi:hypothetical protein